MFSIHALSIAFEALIVILAIGLVLFKKSIIGLGIAVTYGIYVFYDIAKYTRSDISLTYLHGLFFVATLSMLLVILGLYRNS
jgi:hypothetical protein